MSDSFVAQQARRDTLALIDVLGAFETNPDGSWDYASPRFLDMLSGLPESSILGREWIKRIHPDEVQRVLAEYRQAREFRRPWQQRFRMLGADAVPVWLSINASPLPSPADTAGVRYIGVVTDVTAEVRAEQLTRSTEETLAALSELITEGLAVTRDDHIIAANSAAARLLGVESAEALVGRRTAEFIAPGDESRFAVRFQEQAAGGDGHTYTGRIIRESDGRRVLLSIHGRTIQYAGAPARMVSFVSVDDPHIQSVLEDRNFRRLQSLESLLPFAYHRVSIEGTTFGIIEYANERFAQHLGRTPQDLVGRSVLEFTHPDHQDASRADMARMSLLDGRQGTVLRRWNHADGTDVHLAMDISVYRDPVTGHAVSMALSREVDPGDPAIDALPIR